METGRCVSVFVKPLTLPVAAWAAGVVGAAIMAGCGFPGAEDLGVVACPSRLLPGQVVVTEILADPGGAAGEWIEIFNATDQAVDLRGVVLAVEGAGGEALQRHVMRAARVEPGAYFVLGRDGAGAAAAPVGYVYGEALHELPDDGGRVSLRCDVIDVDVAVYPGAPPGVAVGVSGATLPDALSNDDPAGWCAAQRDFAPGRAGSPGAANEACAGMPGEAPPGTCEQDGAVREAVAPAPGDLVITEVMPNPAAVSDDAGEWIELYVGRDVDLDGLSVGAEPGALRVVVAGGACLRAVAGSHVVLAASGDPGTNGGLGAIAGELGLGLRNTGGTLIIGHGSAVLDEVRWASAPAGRSLALDPAHRSAEANDVAAHWCTSTGAPYGSGDIGTPGVANGPCDEAPPDPPGDAGEPGARVDAGPPGSRVDAMPSPSMDAAPPPVPTCSDGDGVMRPIVGPAPGSVHITEIMADSRAVADSEGEWIELRFDAAADLNGLELGKEPGQVLATIEAAQCLTMPAGGHAVLARTFDPGRNGGLPRVDAELGFGLVNGGGALFVGASGAVLDRVSHGPAIAGASASLDERDDTTWCTSPADAVYGRGDRGTPGAPNPACAGPAPRAAPDRGKAPR
jgi:Lamin Tail Domain